MLPSRSKLGLSGLGSTQELDTSNGDLYYNSRPESHMGWTYQPPPPPVITQQPKPTTTQHFQPYERGYPKTLESLAEKVKSYILINIMNIIELALLRQCVVLIIYYHNVFFSTLFYIKTFSFFFFQTFFSHWFDFCKQLNQLFAKKPEYILLKK